MNDKNDSLEEAFENNLITIAGNLFTKDFLCRHIELEPIDPAGSIDILESFRARDNPNEICTEDHFILKILEGVLGFDEKRRDRQTLPSEGSTIAGKKMLPDIIYYTAGAQPSIESIEVLIESKYWGRKLGIKVDANESKHGRSKADDAFATSPPEAQITQYLKYTGCNWGILTNGKLWRLFYGKSSTAQSQYIEFDIETILDKLSPEKDFHGVSERLPIFDTGNNSELEAFKLFYKLFNSAAFANKWQELESIHKGNIEHQETVENQLHRRAYPALVAIANGILDELGKRGIAIDDEVQKSVYYDSLYMLYRLLFLFYAEDKRLITFDNENYSITKHASQVYKRVRKEKFIDISSDRITFGESKTFYKTTKSNLATKIFELFRFIDKGNKELGIYQYNGDLFKSREGGVGGNGFVDEYKIGDYYLAAALYFLGYRYEKSDNREVSIDYSTLDVRQLGNLYERILLFNQPESGPEYDFYYKGAVGKGSKITLNFPDDDWLYYEVDPTERKSTGVYYTPDYIVQYIVQNTLDPLLEECDSVADVLNLKVLDPAMGSGHFLIRAIDYLADYLCENLGEVDYDDTSANLIATGELKISNETVTALVGEGWHDDFETKVKGQLEDLGFWRRIVAKRSIYGVDINPLAVELAKVAIWLHTLSSDSPLQFLDNHLRCGNSLIGVNEFDEYIELSLFKTTFEDSMRRAIGHLTTIAESRELSAADVKHSFKLYNQARERMEPFKRRFDFELAAKYFVDDFDNYREFIAPDTGLLVDDSSDPEFRAALQAAEEKRIFHWKLEFPEVFYNLDGLAKKTPGFDAVVGNPPYVRSRNLNKTEREYYKKAFETTHRTFDIYIPFLEQSYRMTKNCGYYCYIIPRSYLNQPYARLNRQLNLNKSRIISIVDLYSESVFEDASIINCIPIFKKGENEENVVNVLELTEGQEKNRKMFAQSYFLNHPFQMIKIDMSGEEIKVIDKIKTGGIKLSEIFYLLKGVEVYQRGSGKTKDEFIYNELDKNADNFKRYIEGKDIEKFGINYQNKYLSYQPDKHCSGKFPELFKNEKIDIKRIIGEGGLVCTVDKEKFYTENTIICCLRKYDLKDSEKVTFTHGLHESKDASLYALCAILNSKLMSYLYKNLFGDKLQTYVKYLNDLRIKKDRRARGRLGLCV